MKKSLQFFALLILPLITVLNGCAKDKTEIYPGLVGEWSIEPGPVEPCSFYNLTIYANGLGRYYSGNSGIGEIESFEGQATMQGNDLYIDGHKICTIIEIKDSIAYLGPLNAPICTESDSLLFDKVLKSDFLYLYHFL